jgi:exopolysaccharide biosynthesis protein
MHLFKKPFSWAITYSIILTCAFSYVILDTFFIERSYSAAPIREESDENENRAPLEPVFTKNGYQDENIALSITEEWYLDTKCFICDVKLKDPTLLKGAFAYNTFGRNIGAVTSQIAAENKAIFAINGDYYGFRDDGYVLRNGVFYRSGSSEDCLIMDKAGDFYVKNESDISSEDTSGAWQIFTFGPVLVNEKKLVVGENQEVTGRSSISNPRTAIAQLGPLHYVFIVSEGRNGESKGLSLFELGQKFVSLGATVAYNLDGGGSSAMVFNSELINNPTDGRKGREREVSDIVYIGY